jgi:hypothetical protein
VLQKRNKFNFLHASVGKGLDDSTALRLNFHIPAEKSYLYYNSTTAVDSLEIKWETEQGKCCGERVTYNRIASVKFNNTQVTPLGKYTFRK